jgi:hypothetical protein
VLKSGASEVMSGHSGRFGPLPVGPWSDSSDAAVEEPIPAAGRTIPTGFLVCGLSPRRVIDSDYRSFVNLIAGHVGTSPANARAYDKERKRAEALADLDRQKTAFFSNVTPVVTLRSPHTPRSKCQASRTIERSVPPPTAITPGTVEQQGMQRYGHEAPTAATALGVMVGAVEVSLLGRFSNKSRLLTIVMAPQGTPESAVLTREPS